MKIFNKTIAFVALALAGVSSVNAACSDISRNDLINAVTAANSAGAATGGYGLPMWATVVDESGKICQVTTSGVTGAQAGNSEWLGSRVISAQKAFTANAFSTDSYVISTGELYAAVQPGGSLYGLQFSNPVDSGIAYLGNPGFYGTARDSLTGKRVGGVNVFGGGLALYKNGKKIGALGVSGDTSCRDHAYAWRIRAALGAQPVGIVGIATSNVDAAGAVQTPLTGATVGDELIISGGTGYWNAWAQPACPNSTSAITVPNGIVQAQ